MEKSRTWSRRELLRRYLLFGISLFIIAFGISIITRSDLGTSPISSVPYVASLNTPLTMGTYFFIFTIVLICMQMLLLGKRGGYRTQGRTADAVPGGIRPVGIHRRDHVDAAQLRPPRRMP